MFYYLLKIMNRIKTNTYSTGTVHTVMMKCHAVLRVMTTRLHFLQHAHYTLAIRMCDHEVLLTDYIRTLPSHTAYSWATLEVRIIQYQYTSRPGTQV